MFTVRSRAQTPCQRDFGVTADGPVPFDLVGGQEIPFRGSPDVGGDERVPLTGSLHALQGARQRHSKQAELPGNLSPEHLLIPAPDAPGEIESPGLDIALLEPKGGEGNVEFGIPPSLVHERCDLPAPVPVLVESRPGAPLLPGAGCPAGTLALARHLPVELDSGRCGAEHEAVLSVVKRYPG